MIYIFEGMDNCLKDTLIKKLRGLLAPNTQVLKFSNPPVIPDQEDYQRKHFRDMFEMLTTSIGASSSRNLILNRAHLGEYVYAPIYRNYEAEWIFDLEEEFLASSQSHISLTKLILSYDSENSQLKKREDGRSLSGINDKNLNNERERFIEAFNKSRFQLKVELNLSSYIIKEEKDPKKEIDLNALLEKIL